jgi:hypothetical protein
MAYDCLALLSQPFVAVMAAVCAYSLSLSVKSDFIRRQWFFESVFLDAHENLLSRDIHPSQAIPNRITRGIAFGRPCG